jgi:uncharacterized protein DUF3568
MTRATALLLTVAALAPSGGCVAAAIAAGAATAYGVVKYTENEAYQDFKAPLRDTWKATVAALQENGYPVSEAVQPGTNDGMIDVNDAVVHVETIPGDLTRVRIRIGTFSNDDNKRRASLILESVGNRVG